MLEDDKFNFVNNENDNDKCPDSSTLNSINPQVDEENLPPFKSHPGFTDGYHRLVIFLMGFVGIFILAFIIEAIVLAADPSIADTESENYIRGISLINDLRYSLLFLILVALLFPKLKYILKRFKNWKNILLGLALGVSILGATATYSRFLSFFYEPQINNNESIARAVIIYQPLLSALIVGIIGPICEELTYRYGLFGLCKKKSVVLAYFVTILVFSLIHFDFTAADIVNELANLPVYMIAGGLLCFTYHKFGLEASITAHVFNNLYSVVGVLILNALGQ